MNEAQDQSTESATTKGSDLVVCYDVGGLKIRPLSRDAIITQDIGNAFSLGRCYAADYDVTLEGFICLDNDYFQNMPVFVREYVDKIDDQSPWCIKGPEGQIAILARGKETSAALPTILFN